MTNYERLQFELNQKDYFDDETISVYSQVLEENGLDFSGIYSKENDQINMLEAVYTVLQMLSNNIDMFMKVETKYGTTTAAYQYLQKRLEDLRKEINRIKKETHYRDSEGNTSGLVGYMFYNQRCASDDSDIDDGYELFKVKK